MIAQDVTEEIVGKDDVEIGGMARELIGGVVCVQMRELDLRLFEAMNNAGGTNQSYLWVEAVVRLMRPMAAIIVMSTWAWTSITGDATPAIDNFASAIGFYLFGDRTLFYSRKALVK